MTEITTVQELDALPVGSVARDSSGTLWEHVTDKLAYLGGRQSLWVSTTRVGGWTAVANLPFTVLHRPDAPAPSADDREALARDARSLQAARYNCDCQNGGVDAASIDADYLHAIGRRIERVLAARQVAPVDAEACTFCEQARDDLSIGSDGTTRACQDCIAEGEVRHDG